MMSSLFCAVGMFDKDMDDCWLAATNPGLFHQVRNRRKIEEVIVSKTCENVQKMIHFNLIGTRKHISLRVVINLVFGAVRIFQLQVQFLYDNAQYLVTHSNINWKSIVRLQRKRRGGIINCEKPSKLAKINETFSQNILNQMSIVLELNDDEKKIIATSDFVSPTDNFCLHETVPLNLRADLFYSDDSDDFGGCSKDEVNHLLNIISLRKRKCQESDNDVSQGTEIFKMPSAHRATAIRCEPEPHCSYKTPPRNQTENCSDIDALEERFRENIAISSTPIYSSLNAKSSNAIDTVNFGNKSNKQKEFHNKAFDKFIEINDHNFAKQFEYSSTLRHIDAKNDIVPLFEMKKVISKVITTTPCHRLYSKMALHLYNSSLKSIKVKEDPSIINAIHSCLDNNVIISGLNFSEEKKKATKRKMCDNDQVNGEIQNIGTKITDLNCKKKKPARSYTLEIESEPYMVIEKVKRNEPVQTDKNSKKSDKYEELLKVINELWHKQIYPVNLKTICRHQPTLRKDIALTFFALIDLKAKGDLEIIKDPVTHEVIHIIKMERCCQKA